MTTNIIGIRRDQSGALISPLILSMPERNLTEPQQLFKTSLFLLKIATMRKQIAGEYDAMSWERISARKGSKRTGCARHHEIYDISQDGKYCLVCVRDVEGTEYGISTTGKEYFVVERFRKAVRVYGNPKFKSLAAKKAKASGSELGKVIAACLTSLTPAELKDSQIVGVKPPATTEEIAERVAAKMRRRIATAVAVSPEIESQIVPGPRRRMSV